MKKGKKKILKRGHLGISKRTGRKKVLTDKQIESLKKDHARGKLSIAQLTEKYKGISIPTLYRYLNN